ncbi:MAG: PEP-CTERM sorting domain-containing protein [Phycisphaerales bacterium]|nr:PEP-CTERM sorting domain-containing protein [Phycisphaerales bacterium]
MAVFNRRRAVAQVGLGGVAIAVFGAGSALAATGIYHSRTDFLAANPAVLTQDFSTPVSPSVTIDFGDFVASTDATTTLDVAGGRLERAGIGDTENSLVLTFDIPVYALGIDIFDFGNPSSGELRATTDTGTIDYQIATYVNGNPEISLFWGVIDEAGFTSITFHNTTRGDHMMFDDLQYRTVPEPSTALLTLGGLAASLFGRRR